MLSRTLVAIILTPIVTFAGPIDETIPEPWFKNGVSPAKDQCLAGIDTEVQDSGLPNLSLKCADAVEGFVGIWSTYSVVLDASYDA
jgi:hypothetical protein